MGRPDSCNMMQLSVAQKRDVKCIKQCENHPVGLQHQANGKNISVFVIQIMVSRNLTLINTLNAVNKIGLSQMGIANNLKGVLALNLVTTSTSDVFQLYSEKYLTNAK
ncbi:MAG: hypothetical protein ACLTLQ_00005 [[Clostridium] scindens]